MSVVRPNDRASVLEANKREMFDGMRAYHQSEIEHKRDAIEVLKALLAGAGAVYAAIIIPSNKIPYAGWLAAGISAAITFATISIVRSTNAKIARGHLVYQSFGDEYMRTCRLLGLYYASDYGEIIKQSRAIGRGDGWKSTQNILRSFGTTICLLVWTAAVYVWLSSSASGSG
jgi:hypothetical protein